MRGQLCSEKHNSPPPNALPREHKPSSSAITFSFSTSGRIAAREQDSWGATGEATTLFKGPSEVEAISGDPVNQDRCCLGPGLNDFAQLDRTWMPPTNSKLRADGLFVFTILTLSSFLNEARGHASAGTGTQEILMDHVEPDIWEEKAGVGKEMR